MSDEVVVEPEVKSEEITKKESSLDIREIKKSIEKEEQSKKELRSFQLNEADKIADLKLIRDRLDDPSYIPDKDCRDSILKLLNKQEERVARDGTFVPIWEDIKNTVLMAQIKDTLVRIENAQQVDKAARFGASIVSSLKQFSENLRQDNLSNIQIVEAEMALKFAKEELEVNGKINQFKGVTSDIDLKRLSAGERIQRLTYGKMKEARLKAVGG